MSFKFEQLILEQFRCFERLELSLEPDVTLLFAENGGGKSAILQALAIGLGPFQTAIPKGLKLDALRDVRRVTLPDRVHREPAGPCTIRWSAQIGLDFVGWSQTIHPSSNCQSRELGSLLAAMEKTRLPGSRWPLFGFYRARS